MKKISVRVPEQKVPNTNPLMSKEQRKALYPPQNASSGIFPHIRNKLDQLALESPIGEVKDLSGGFLGGLRVLFRLADGATQELQINPAAPKNKAVKLLPASNSYRSRAGLTLSAAEIGRLSQGMEARLKAALSKSQLKKSRKVLRQLRLIA